MLQKSPDRNYGGPKGDPDMPFWTNWSMDMWPPMLGSVATWNLKVGSALAAFNGEWFDFVNRRAREDFALIQRLGACQRPDEAWRVYSEFLVKAAGDYRQEFMELARLGSTVAMQSVPAMRTLAGEAGREDQRSSLVA
jgi:hypothetical protein